MGWPRGDKNGQWWGYDLPLPRDRLFWVVTTCCAGLTIFWILTGRSIVSSLIFLVFGPVIWGVLPAAVRNFWRGLREPISDRTPTRRKKEPAQRC